MPTRLNEATKLDFKRVIVPKRVRKSGEPWPKDIEARTLRQAMEQALGGGLIYYESTLF